MRILKEGKKVLLSHSLGEHLIHQIEKMIWGVKKRKLCKAGKNTFVQWPYEIQGEKYIEIGDDFKAKKRLQLEAFDRHNGVHFHPRIQIGNSVSINFDVHIGACNKIIIEDGVLIASKVFITDHYHGTISASSLSIGPQQRILYSKGPIHIKKNVWIGEGVAIMPNVTIGEGAVIGANSVVTHDVPERCVVAGIPARIISDFREKLHESKGTELNG